MSAHTVFREKHLSPLGWMSEKGFRAAALVGSLLALSIAVNAIIIFTARGGL